MMTGDHDERHTCLENEELGRRTLDQLKREFPGEPPLPQIIPKITNNPNAFVN